MRPLRFGGRTEQYIAGLQRFEDAQALVKKSRWRGAMYLAGYAVECRLKARLMEIYGCSNLNDLENKIFESKNSVLNLRTHNIYQLFKLLNAEFDAVTLKAFKICSQWTTDWRYDRDNGAEKECRSFMDAVSTLSNFIDRSAY